MTYLTLGGSDKTTCTTGDVAINLASGQARMHGPLSWCFGSSLIDNRSDLRWRDILYEMAELMQLQHLQLAYFFHGQPTARFSE